MLTKRIIPCLDIKEGRTVKGTNFLQLRDAGDPVELARQYSLEGADVVYDLLKCGADKVSINSSAIKSPRLITKIATLYGEQCLIVAIDAKYIHGGWKVFTHGGTRETSWTLFDWAKEAQELGAGEILFTSMDHDGTKNGFAIEALGQLNKILTIPIIASGGAGKAEHFVSLFQETDVSAGLAASIFHFQEVRIPVLKQELYQEGIAVRI